MMTRREFVKTGAGAVAGAGLVGTAHGAVAPQPATPAAPATPGKRALRKAVMIGMCQEGSTLLDKFKVLRDAGFEGAELDSPSTTLNKDIVRKAAEETGIVPHGVVDSSHWKIPLNVPDAEARAQAVADLKTAIRDAHDWGASSVLLVPCVVNKDMPYDNAWDLSTGAIREALPLATELQVRIAIENVWNNFIHGPLEAARYVDQFQSPWVKWHLDLGNLEAFGWGEQWARILGPRVWKLHIKEYSRKKRDEEGLWKGFNVDLLEGDNNWRAIVKALDQSGYTSGDSRWATAESRGGDAKRMKDISEKMDRIFAL